MNVCASSAGWNFASVWEVVAAALPQAPAFIQGARQLSWEQFERRARGLAAFLVDTGLGRQDKVALYLYNAPEYMEAAFACMKASLVPVNTNYRYQHDELRYLFDNADAAAVVFYGAFTELVSGLRADCPKVRAWIHVDDGTQPCPDWAVPYEAAVAGEVSTSDAAVPRSGDDLILIYTGGSTGLPRGVMWRQDDLYTLSNTAGDPQYADLEAVRARLARRIAAGLPGPIGLPAAPLMHGTAFVFAASILTRGGTVVITPGRRFDAAELLTTIDQERVSDLCIVGDAFCRPMVETLDARPGYWNLGTLKAVSSSGMMWSRINKEGLLRHAPQALLVDFLNSSEASGMARSVSSRDRPPESDRFKPGENTIVIDDAGRPLAPGSSAIGRVAVRGRMPLGYYGDPEKTAATFVVIDGVRYAVPGDYARLETDGSIVLLGRGSVSINTGGEKVFPDEVEQCIKELPGVVDALVVGVPDERFGQIVTALVQSTAGTTIAATQLIDHVRAHLAHHKAPQHVLFVDDVGRGPNGKADYPAAQERMRAWLTQGASRSAF